MYWNPEILHQNTYSWPSLFYYWERLGNYIFEDFFGLLSFRAWILRHFRPISCPACRACQNQCNWLSDRHAGHAKLNATGFTIDMPGMPNPMQLASRSTCPACQTQCNWLHDRHARHAKPNATGFTIDMPGMPNPMQLASRSACPACQTQCNWLHDRHNIRNKAFSSRLLTSWFRQTSRRLQAKKAKKS